MEALVGIWKSAGNVGRLKDVYILIEENGNWAYINDISGSVDMSSFEGARAFGTYVFADGEITLTSDAGAWSCAGESATYRYFFNSEGLLFAERIEEPCPGRSSIIGSGLWERNE